MKNCKTCGASLDETAAFCVMCGAKLEDGVQTDLQAPPIVNQNNYDNVLNAEKPAPSPREMFFKATSSSKALVAVILTGLSFVFSIISLVVNTFYITNETFWYNIIKESGVSNIDPNLLKITADVMSVMLGVFMFIAIIPVALNALGVLFIYIDSKKRTLNTRGLIIIKSINIFSIVMIGLYAVLILLSSLISINILLVLSVSGLIILPILLLQVAFIKAINKIKIVIKNDLNYSIPTFIPVIMIVACGLSAFASLGTYDLFSIVIGATGIAGNLLIAICMFDYNNAIALMRVKNIYDKPVNRGNGL